MPSLLELRGSAQPEMIAIDTPDAHTEGTVRRVTIHPEGQAVKVRFLEDCLYVPPKADR